MQLKAEELTGCTVTWLRESDDADGDAAWNAKHEKFHDLRLNVDSKVDLPSVWEAGSQVGYKVVVVFPDGSNYDQDYTIVI